MTGRVLVVVAAALAFGIPSGSVEAQDELKFGVRAGFGISETAFVFGGQVFKDIDSVENLGVEGIVQVGLGNVSDNIGFTTVEFGGLAKYTLQDDGEKKFFALAGPVIYRFSVDDLLPGSVIDIGGSTTDVSLLMGGGVELENGLGAEGGLHLSGIMDFQAMVYWNF
jgi:hypothetical protein